MSRYLLIFLKRKMVSEIKRPLLWKCLDSPLRYMYVVVQCGLSSVVEDGTTISVVDCVKCSVLVNHCVRRSCSFWGSTYPKKKHTKNPKGLVI